MIIHPTAKVHPTALLGPGVIIGPEVIIGPNVYIGAYSVLGGIPEHRDFYDDYGQGRTRSVVVSEGAKIFEFVTIQAGTQRATYIGARAAIFNHAHIAHDCRLQAGVLVGGHASLAGHVTAMIGANISGRSNVHQHTVIGAYSFLAGCAYLTRDLPPGMKWMGIPARPAGANEVGLKRQGMTLESCEKLYFEEWEALRRKE